MMTSPSQNLNIKARHGGFDVRAGGDEKQKINFAWPNIKYYRSNYVAQSTARDMKTGTLKILMGAPSAILNYSFGTVNY